MSGEVTAIPWKGSNTRWRVYIPPQPMPDGGKTDAERVVRTAYSKTEALEWGKARRSELIEEYKARLRGELEAKRPKVMTFDTLVTKHWFPFLHTRVKQQTRKLSGVEANESIYKFHLKPFVGHKTLDQITNSVVTSLIIKWGNGGYAGPDGEAVRATNSPKTLNNRKTVLNAALRFAVKEGHLALMPCHIDVGHVETEESSYYDADTYEALLGGAVEDGLRTYVAALLGGDAGLRRNEILALDVKHVHFDSATITIAKNVYWAKDDKEERHCIETLPKGKKIKSVAATKRLLAALKKLVGDRKSGRVLLSDEGGQVTPKMLRVWMRRAEKCAGVKVRGGWHILRHSHLTHLGESGATLFQIAEQARHNDLRVTQKYLHRGAAAATAAIELLEKKRTAG